MHVEREAHASYNGLHSANSLSLVKAVNIWYSIQMAVTSTCWNDLACEVLMQRKCMHQHQQMKGVYVHYAVHGC